VHSNLSSMPSRTWPIKRRRARSGAQIDFTLLLISFVLIAWGLLSILSASAPVAENELHHSLYYLQRQGLWCIFGLVALIGGALINLAVVRYLARGFLIFTAVLLLATHIPGLGVTELGSSRWLRFGPISVQPSELAKVSVVLYLADLLARRWDSGWTWKSLRNALLPTIGVLGLVLLQPDLGTTIVLALAVFVLFFCSGTNPWILSFVGFSGVLGVLYQSWVTPYQRQRWIGFLDPWADPQGVGYQLVQSLMAIGSGGILGEGWGQSKQKLFYLPIQYSDFIFAVIAEELGLIGGIGLLILFLALAWRGIAIAGQARDPFMALLGIALTSIIVAQAFINIGVVTASLPTTGIPLPFLSFGGSSLTVSMLSVGLLLNISRYNNRHLTSRGGEDGADGASVATSSPRLQ
jgi:cell division protein FtsW